MGDFDRNRISTSINKAAKFLFNSLNADGGVKFEDESSTISGIWVTAETIESLLMSTTLPLTAYKRIEPMISFLMKSQNQDGSWTVVTGERSKASSIATGNCVYALKLAMRYNYLKNNDLVNAVDKGEEWLRKNCCVEKDGYVFWCAEYTQDYHLIDPNIDVASRMEYIFSSYYAAMGFINPKGYFVEKDIDESLLIKAKRFFKLQAEFFIDKYKLELEKLDDPLLFAKVSSSICRIVNAISMLHIEISEDIRLGLCNLLQICSKNPFMTTSITVHTDKIQGANTVYNNNTPYDMATAFLSLKMDSSTLATIVNEYLDKQKEDGYWYLNFYSSYKIKTWSTAEALIVLNRAIDSYNEIESNDLRKSLNQEKQIMKGEKQTLIEKYNRVRINLIVSSIISLLLSTAGIVGMVFWINHPDYKDSVLSTVFSILIIPLAVWFIKQLWEIIKSIIDSKRTNNKENTSND